MLLEFGETLSLSGSIPSFVPMFSSWPQTREGSGRLGQVVIAPPAGVCCEDSAGREHNDITMTPAPLLLCLQASAQLSTTSPSHLTLLVSYDDNFPIIGPVYDITFFYLFFSTLFA